MKRLGDLPYLAHQPNKNSKSGVFIRSNPGKEDVSVASLLLSFKMCSESGEPRCESQIQLVILEESLSDAQPQFPVYKLNSNVNPTQ